MSRAIACSVGGRCSCVLVACLLPANVDGRWLAGGVGSNKTGNDTQHRTTRSRLFLFVVSLCCVGGRCVAVCAAWHASHRRWNRYLRRKAGCKLGHQKLERGASCLPPIPLALLCAVLTCSPAPTLAHTMQW